MADTFDPKTMKEVTERAADLESLYATLKKNYQEYDKMVLMNWDDKPSGETLKVTISPSAHNAVKGAVRLMTAAEPTWSVPFEKNSIDGKEKSEKLEGFAGAVWDLAGRVRGNPVQFSAVYSAICYGRMDLVCTMTEDLVAHAKGGSKAAEMRVNRIAERTPVLFDVWDPKSGYPEFDAFGLSAYYRKVRMKAGSVLDQWGAKALEMLGDDRNEDVDYCDFWDAEKHVVWIDGKSGALLMEAHGLPVIPIVSQVTEGENFYEKPEERIQPFLYGWQKTDLWKRQNLSLTVLYTMIFSIGANPMYLYQYREDPTLQVDYDVPGGLVKIREGESYAPLVKQVIDPSIMQGMEIANQLEGETMIQKQALGQPLTGNPSFSLVSLMGQMGRAPLISPQKRGGWGLGSIMEAALLILKDKGKTAKVKTSQGSVLELSPADIPDDLMIEALLEESMPQDRLGNANLAQMVTNAKLMSRRWAREKILGEGQSDAMTKEIWTEEMEDLMTEMMQAQYAPRIQQMLQQAMAGGQQQPGAGGSPVGGPPPGMNGQPFAPGADMQGMPGAAGGMVPAGGPMGDPGMMPPDGGMMV